MCKARSIPTRKTDFALTIPMPEMNAEANTRVQEKAILITGGAKRIGAVITRTLHAAGANVIVHCNRSRDEAEALAAELNGVRAKSAAVVQGDLLGLNALEGLVVQAASMFGTLDGLVNNASTFYSTPVGSISEHHWNELDRRQPAGAAFSCAGRRAVSQAKPRRDRQYRRYPRRAAAQGFCRLQHRQGRPRRAHALARHRARAGDPRQRRLARRDSVARQRRALQAAGAATHRRTDATQARRNAGGRCGRGEVSAARCAVRDGADSGGGWREKWRPVRRHEQRALARHFDIDAEHRFNSGAPFRKTMPEEAHGY